MFCSTCKDCIDKAIERVGGKNVAFIHNNKGISKYTCIFCGEKAKYVISYFEEFDH